MDTSMDVSMDASMDISRDISMDISMDTSMDISLDISVASWSRFSFHLRYQHIRKYILHGPRPMQAPGPCKECFVCILVHSGVPVLTPTSGY